MIVQLLILLLLIAVFTTVIFFVLLVFKKSGVMDYKKKRRLIVGAALAVIILIISGLLRSPIDLFRVEKMELHTYDHDRGGRVELALAEQWVVALLYNISPRGGEITGEPCCDAYRVEVYYQDGSEMHISEGVFSKMIVRIPCEKGRDDFYVTCPFLVDYIYLLANTYDLPIG